MARGRPAGERVGGATNGTRFFFSLSLCILLFSFFFRNDNFALICFPRLLSSPNRPVTHPDISHRLGVFQSQISRWSGSQQTARDAMTRHASWLRKFGQDIQTTRSMNNIVRNTNTEKKPAMKTRSSEIASAALSPKSSRGSGRTTESIQIDAAAGSVDSKAD